MDSTDTDDFIMKCIRSRIQKVQPNEQCGARANALGFSTLYKHVSRWILPGWHAGFRFSRTIGYLL